MLATALAASAATGIAAAEGAATTKTLCAITSTLTCDVAGCVRGPANAVNLPVFVSIDTENNVVEAAREGGDLAHVQDLEHTDPGRHPGAAGRRTQRGWSATVDQVSGNFTGTVADNGVGYIIFGSCLAY